jgi:hypothetical protein
MGTAVRNMSHLTADVVATVSFSARVLANTSVLTSHSGMGGTRVNETVSLPLSLGRCHGHDRKCEN